MTPVYRILRKPYSRKPLDAEGAYRFGGRWSSPGAPPELAQIGDDFVRHRQGAILIVPPTLAPTESNWLINPRHPEFGNIRINPPEPFHYDPRFFSQ